MYVCMCVCMWLYGSERREEDRVTSKREFLAPAGQSRETFVKRGSDDSSSTRGATPLRWKFHSFFFFAKVVCCGLFAEARRYVLKGNDVFPCNELRS